MRLIDADTCLSQSKPYSPKDENSKVIGNKFDNFELLERNF